MSNDLIFKFQEATRAKSKASILIEGLSGKGKSGLALVLAHTLAGNWEDVFDIDTENKSIQLFTDIPCSAGGTFKKFQIGEFTPDIGYKPSNYLAFRDAAIEAGAKVVINDSISHAWSYKGGILELVAELKKTSVRYQKDSYAAWGDDVIVKEKNELLKLFRDYRCHIISTVRVKEKMEYSTDDKGKTVLTSLGEQEIMQADMKYEPDLVLHMIAPGSKTMHPVAKVIKTRYAIFEKDQEYEFTPRLCAELKSYLDEGTSPEVLLEERRQDYIKGVQEYLNQHKNQVAIWKAIKENAGYKDTPLTDLTLDVITALFIKLTID